MKTIKQLLRQPLKTVVGITIVALAFAILVTCVGQYTATDLSRENLDDRYTTIGLLSDQYLKEKTDRGIKYFSKLPEETQVWVDETVQTRTDLIKSVSSTGLISAYIPKLKIDNFSQYKDGYKMGFYSEGYPYRCAMLEVTLTKIGHVGKENIEFNGPDGQKCTSSATYLCIGTVERVIGLEQGFVSPVGKTILLHITTPSLEAYDSLDLMVGQRYIVYGEDYSYENRYGDINRYLNYIDCYVDMFGELKRKNGMPDHDPMLDQYDCVMTLCDPATLTAWLPKYDEDGNYLGYERSDQYEVHYWEGEQLKRKWVPYEEYAPFYQLPAITLLNDSVDDFLASEDGALWRKALEKMEINNHGFPVLCVDKLGYQAAFAREQARVVEGRDFAENELTGGEKVCIIAQSLATANGLQVGDTIELRAYGYDNTYSLQLDEWALSASFPSAAMHSEYVGFTSETETYTIIGLYRQEDAWQNSFDAYGFTPNTIFVPKSSVTSEMVTKNKGIYSTLVLHNGKLEEFKTLMEEAGYPDLFICYDQGYSEFVASLDAYEDISEKALYIGLAAFVAIILLFLFLYPAQQKRSLRLMGALGASAWGRFRHTFISILCVLVPGAALGGYVGSKLWTRIAAALMEWINIEIALESDMTAIAPKLTALGIAVVAALALVVCAALSRNRGLMKRR